MKDFWGDERVTVSLPTTERALARFGRVSYSANADSHPVHDNINAVLPFAAETMPFVHHQMGRLDVGYAKWGKRLLDVVLIILSLPVVVPVVFFAAIALWLESGQPFYTQERLGRNGRRFRILKLRTMVRDADKRLSQLLAQRPDLKREWDETQKLKNDPRITPVGRFLRVTSLDELPQLWNVIMGQMSLVGPRPMMPDQLSLYGNPYAYFAVRPGLTGIWQVSERNESSFAQRGTADRQYLRDLSLRVDCALIWRTFSVVLKGTGY